MVKQNKNEILRRAIQKDLLGQLERNGTTGKVFIDLVEDYMKLWDTKNKLSADIEKNGVKTTYVSNNGTENMKKNDSVDMLVKVNGQMLKLLGDLKIKANDEVVSVDEGAADLFDESYES